MLRDEVRGSRGLWRCPRKGCGFEEPAQCDMYDAGRVIGARDRPRLLVAPGVRSWIGLRRAERTR